MVAREVQHSFKQEDFEELNIANLMVNIWHYSIMCENEKYRVVCAKYKKWCITALKKKWKDRYINISYIVRKLCQRDLRLADFSKITAENISNVYNLIEGDLMSR